MIKIKKIEYEHYDGKVYDLCVENTHTYNIEGLAVHNSSAGCLISYLLNITEVDPIRWNLQFERFLRDEEGGGFPDIDYDLAEATEFKEFLINEWGQDNVVLISNWNTFQIKSLIKDLSKFYGIDYQEVNSVTTKMVKESLSEIKKEHGIQAGAYTPTFEELKKYSGTLREYLEKYPFLEKHIKALSKQIRSCFTDKVEILTLNGYKNIKDINKDSIAYFDYSGKLNFNDDYEVYFLGEKEVFSIELEDGSYLELTGDHEVLTQNGYKQVKDLLKEDFFVSLNL
ncbi:hypothetical protein M0R19_03995 [Candidatus Pacearchaeota archaeon]|jgi:hypothetical protein|nr:hypothetical protein [Candidatus Pacearchaeota archaeon]